MRRRLLTLLLSALVPTLVACSLFDDDDSNACECQPPTALVTFVVVDGAGEPVTDAVLTHRVVRTDREFTVSQAYADEGRYIAIDDAHKDLVRPAGDDIWIHGESSAGSFDQVFSVDVPGACRCNVHKMGGPDTLVIGQGGARM